MIEASTATRWLLALLLLAPVGCHHAAHPGPGAGDGDGGAVAPPGDGGIITFMACGANQSCPGSLVCRYNACIDPPAACTTDEDCENDSYCMGGECLPYGVGPRGPYDPECKRLAIAPFFKPATQCNWTQSTAGSHPDSMNVESTPLVVDFNFDNDPHTLHPSLVFMTYNCQDGSSGQDSGCYGVIRVVDGATCKDQFTIDKVPLIGSTTPAIGDLDGDGRPDIVAERIAGGVAGFKYDPTANGGKGDFVEMWPTNYTTFDALDGHWDSLSIHDMDNDGVPEIIEAGPHPAAYSNQGVLLTPNASTINTSYEQQLHAVVADVDGDGVPELLDGKEAFHLDKAAGTWDLVAGMAGTALGQVAIGDFGTFSGGVLDRSKLDGIPELVVVSAGKVRIQALDGTVVLAPITLPGGGSGGAPTIADFDGDGRAEFAVAGAADYTVFDPDCVTGGTTATCDTGRTDDILWSQASQDASSNVTGSSVFDFDGDGNAEAVYADECFSRVYDGRTGQVEFSQFHTSCTWYENPIVADINGDLKAELAIPSNSACGTPAGSGVSCPMVDPIDQGLRCVTSADCPNALPCVKTASTDQYGLCRCTQTSDCGDAARGCEPPLSGSAGPGNNVCRAIHPTGAPQTGVLVMHDAFDRWVYSRPIWNQHAYAVTNVNDDGTIPKTSARLANWKQPKLNNFRMNVQGALDPADLPDLTSSGGAAPGQEVSLTCTNGTLTLKAAVCNRGAGPVGANEPVSFYVAPKGSAPPICTARTIGKLDPGQCVAVACDWPNAPTSPTDVEVVADDDGTASRPTSECKNGNDVAMLKGVACMSIK